MARIEVHCDMVAIAGEPGEIKCFLLLNVLDRDHIYRADEPVPAVKGAKRA